MPTPPLYDHQKKVSAELNAFWRRSSEPLIITQPTGSGKTRVEAEIARRALSNRERLNVVVPLKSLMMQTRDAFIEWGVPENAINIWHHEHSQDDGSTARPVQITTFDTAAKKWGYDVKSKKWLGPKCDIMLVDECHVRRDYFFKRLANSNGTRFVGFSATPWSRSLGEAWTGGVLEPATTEGLIEGGILIPPRVFAKPSPDLAKVGLSVIDGVTDYNQAELAEAMMCADDVTADIIKTWREKGEDRPTFVFGVNKTHAQKLMQRFIASRAVKEGSVRVYLR